MPVALKGATSGEITLTAASTAGTNTATFPALSGNVVLDTASQTLTNKTLTSPVISTISNTGTLTLPTSTDTLVGRDTTDTLTNKTLTSPTINTPVWGGSSFTEPVAKTATGANVEFTGIPSWVKTILISFTAVSTSGTSVPIIQFGDSGGYEATGYSGTALAFTTSAGTATAANTGVPLDGTHAATNVWHGNLVVMNITGNVWVTSGTLANSEVSRVIQIAASKTLSDVLTQLKFTTVNGTDTYDAGTINIAYA